jgi:hypothetical protein
VARLGPAICTVQKAMRISFSGPEHFSGPKSICPYISAFRQALSELKSVFAIACNLDRLSVFGNRAST